MKTGKYKVIVYLGAEGQSLCLEVQQNGSSLSSEMTEDFWRQIDSFSLPFKVSPTFFTPAPVSVLAAGDFNGDGNWEKILSLAAYQNFRERRRSVLTSAEPKTYISSLDYGLHSLKIYNVNRHSADSLLTDMVDDFHDDLWGAADSISKSLLQTRLDDAKSKHQLIFYEGQGHYSSTQSWKRDISFSCKQCAKLEKQLKFAEIYGAIKDGCEMFSDGWKSFQDYQAISAFRRRAGHTADADSVFVNSVRAVFEGVAPTLLSAAITGETLAALGITVVAPEAVASAVGVIVCEGARRFIKRQRAELSKKAAESCRSFSSFPKVEVEVKPWATYSCTNVVVTPRASMEAKHRPLSLDGAPQRPGTSSNSISFNFTPVGTCHVSNSGVATDVTPNWSNFRAYVPDLLPYKPGGFDLTVVNPVKSDALSLVLRNLGRVDPLSDSRVVITREDMAYVSMLDSSSRKDVPPDLDAWRIGNIIPHIPENGAFGYDGKHWWGRLTVNSHPYVAAAITAGYFIIGDRFSSWDTQLGNRIRDFKRALDGERPPLWSRLFQNKEEYMVYYVIEPLRKTVCECMKANPGFRQTGRDMLFVLSHYLGDSPEVKELAFNLPAKFKSCLEITQHTLVASTLHKEHVDELRCRFDPQERNAGQFIKDKLHEEDPDNPLTHIIAAEYFSVQAEKQRSGQLSRQFLAEATDERRTAEKLFSDRFPTAGKKEILYGIVDLCGQVGASKTVVQYRQKLCALPDATLYDYGKLGVCLVGQKDDGALKPLLSRIMGKYDTYEIAGILSFVSKESGGKSTLNRCLSLCPDSYKKDASAFLAYHELGQLDSASTCAKKVAQHFQDEIAHSKSLTIEDKKIMAVVSRHLATELVGDLEKLRQASGADSAHLEPAEIERKAAELVQCGKNIQLCGGDNETAGKQFSAIGTDCLTRIYHKKLQEQETRFFTGKPEDRVKLTEAIRASVFSMTKYAEELGNYDPGNKLAAELRSANADLVLQNLSDECKKRDAAVLCAQASKVEEEAQSIAKDTAIGSRERQLLLEKKKTEKDVCYALSSRLLHEVLEHNKDDVEVNFNYAKVQLWRDQNDSGKGDLSAAKISFERVVKQKIGAKALEKTESERLQQAAIYVAEIMRQQKDVSGAIKFLTQTLEQRKELARVACELGRHYEAIKKYKKARQYYAQARAIKDDMQIDPSTRYDAILGEARTLYVKNRLEAVNGVLEDGIRSLRENEGQHTQQIEHLQKTQDTLVTYNSAIDVVTGVKISTHVLRELLMTLLEDPKGSQMKQFGVDVCCDLANFGADLYKHTVQVSLNGRLGLTSTNARYLEWQLGLQVLLSAAVHFCGWLAYSRDSLEKKLGIRWGKTISDMAVLGPYAIQVGSIYFQDTSGWNKFASGAVFVGGIASNQWLIYLQERNCQHQGLYALGYIGKDACNLYSIYSVISAGAALKNMGTFEYLSYLSCVHPFFFATGVVITVGLTGYEVYRIYQQSEIDMLNAKERERNRLFAVGQYSEALKINEELLQLQMSTQEHEVVPSLISAGKYSEALVEVSQLHAKGMGGNKTQELLYKNFEIQREADLQEKRYGKVAADCSLLLHSDLSDEVRQRTMYQLGKSLVGQGMLDEAVVNFRAMKEDWTVKFQLFDLMATIGDMGAAKKYAQEAVILLEQKLTAAGQDLEKLEQERWKLRGLVDKLYKFLGFWAPSVLFQGLENTGRKQEEIDQFKEKVKLIYQHQEEVAQGIAKAWEQCKAEAVAGLILNTAKMITGIFWEIVECQLTIIPDRTPLTVFSRFGGSGVRTFDSDRDVNLFSGSRYTMFKSSGSGAAVTAAVYREPGSLVSMSRYSMFRSAERNVGESSRELSRVRNFR